MSAINEWFGYYNAVFTHIHRTYGERELNLYLEHIAKVAYSDIIGLRRPVHDGDVFSRRHPKMT